jgi:hypothetical protein
MNKDIKIFKLFNRFLKQSRLCHLCEISTSNFLCTIFFNFFDEVSLFLKGMNDEMAVYGHGVKFQINDNIISINRTLSIFWNSIYFSDIDGETIVEEIEVKTLEEYYLHIMYTSFIVKQLLKNRKRIKIEEIKKHREIIKKIIKEYYDKENF